jgi:hypothetical protein
MKNVVLIAAVSSLASGLALGQELAPLTPGTPPAATLPWAHKLFFGATGHDFGTVPYGAQLKHRFKMKNIYDVPLQITELRRTCSCLSATASHFRKPLQPNEEGWVDVLMDARRFKGPKTITLYVTVEGDQYASTAALVISANARPDVVFNPGQIDFGIVRAGQALTQTLDVEYAGPLDWRILQIVKSAEAPFTVEPSELYRHTEGIILNRINKVGYRLAVTLKPDAPPGPFREELLLRTNDPGAPALSVVVEGNIQSPLRVAPSVLQLGTIKVGQTVTRRVQVRGDRPFKVVAVEGSRAVTAELPTAAAETHILTLQCRPSQPGDWRQPIVLRTDLDGGATVTVTLEARVEP